MKKYFKKFGIMFVILLAVIGFGVIQNGTTANAATLGQSITTPEQGWKRIDDNDSSISYVGNFSRTKWATNTYGSETLLVMDSSQSNRLRFNFTKGKLRIYGVGYPGLSGNNIISIDGKDYNMLSYNSIGNNVVGLTFSINNLSDGEHNVEIRSNGCARIYLDALDIDADGQLLQYNESISLNESSMDLTEGDSQQLTATTTPAGAQVTWTSSDPTVATVDSTGKVTGVSAGTCTITAKTADGLTTTCTVTVTKKAEESITLDKSTTDLTTGDSETLMATTTPSAVNVTWSSSNASVATVDSNGKVTAVGAGTAIITATTTDGSNLSASCTVNVTANNGGNNGGTTTPTDGTSTIVNIAHAKGDNTNNAGGGVSIIFNGTPDTTLSVVKTADVKSVWVGDTFTYTIVVTNTGTKTAKEVVINDSAPSHIQFIPSEITTTQGTVDSSSTASNIIVNVGDILPSGTVTIKVPVNVVL